PAVRRLWQLLSRPEACCSFRKCGVLSRTPVAQLPSGLTGICTGRIAFADLSKPGLFRQPDRKTPCSWIGGRELLRGNWVRYVGLASLCQHSACTCRLSAKHTVQ